MGGGGGILSGITKFIFGETKVPDVPMPVAPAVQSPITKQDTGAIVKIGTQDDTRNTRTSGGTRTVATRKRSSTLGGFGKFW